MKYLYLIDVADPDPRSMARIAAEWAAEAEDLSDTRVVVARNAQAIAEAMDGPCPASVGWMSFGFAASRKTPAPIADHLELHLIIEQALMAGGMDHQVVVVTGDLESPVYRMQYSLLADRVYGVKAHHCPRQER